VIRISRSSTLKLNGFSKTFRISRLIRPKLAPIKLRNSFRERQAAEFTRLAIPPVVIGCSMYTILQLTASLIQKRIEFAERQTFFGNLSSQELCRTSATA
jgi:hypothetical protein